MGTTTVIEAIEDVVNALLAIKDQYMKFPVTRDQVIAARSTFEELSVLPNIVGAIDGTHIQIKAPPDDAVDYFSRYHQHDIVVQAVADGKRRFLDFSAGYPGCMHDARVLRNSSLFRHAENGDILTEPTVMVSGQEIGPYLVGDSAYVLSPWMMKVFPKGTRDPDEIEFNRELSAARVSVECAFGILKNRWRVLKKQLECRVSFVNDIAVACAVLHNFCIDHNDEWELPDRNLADPDDLNDDNVLRDGEALRELLKDYVANL